MCRSNACNTVSINKAKTVLSGCNVSCIINNSTQDFGSYIRYKCTASNGIELVKDVKK